MIKILLKNLNRKLEYILISVLIMFTIAFTSFYNQKQNSYNKNINDLVENVYLEKTLDNLFNNFNPRYLKIEHKIIKGESFVKILEEYNISKKEINDIIGILKKHINLNNVKKNDFIKFTIDQSKKKLINFSYKISKNKTINLKYNFKENTFNEEIIKTKLTKKILYKENTITNSLYRAAQNEDIPPSIIIEFARIYGFQIDFQRDIRKNDYFQILFETFSDEKNDNIERGEILFANLNLSGINYPLYYLKDKNFEGHYDENGKSIIKTLMKTPINGARLSSSFGMRKHPIDGFNKMHRGTDFAAPTGTPIMASGDGIITKSGWCGGGGNCVKIKHNSTYQTVYAHMSKFASGVKKGVRVKQGQVIGFVGSTGKSTGPHLHYEVIVDGKRVNSQTLKLPSGKILKGDIRKKFETQKIKLNVLKSEIIIGLN